MKLPILDFELSGSTKTSVFVKKMFPTHRFFFIILLLTVCSCKNSITADVAILNVDIIDVETGNIIKSQDVVIHENKITTIVDHGSSKVISKHSIDGSSRYLIPGLWDMHVHVLKKEWYKWQMPLLRANGITGFREMWGDLRVVKHVRSQILKDSLPYFRFVAAGHIIDGKKTYWGNSLSASTPEGATRLVDSLININEDFIKIYSFLEPAAFNAIAKTCNEKNTPFSGHVPHTVWITDASKAGMASMEHLYGFLAEACTNRDSAMSLMQRSVDAFNAGNKEERKRMNFIYQSFVLDNFSHERMVTIAQELKKNNTYVVPTLATLKGIYFINDTAVTNDSRKKYMSKETLDYWKDVTDSDLRENTSDEWQLKRKRWQVEKHIMEILIEEGVSIMAGTDSDNPYAFPGFSLHDEIALYVDLGMTPVEALGSATIVPAKFLHLDDSVGTIKHGKFADLVILDGNPLDDIRNTSKVHCVIANGKVYDKLFIERSIDARVKKDN